MKINQFQEIISTKQGRYFLIDFLVGDIQEIEKQTIEEVKDDEMQQLEHEYIKELKKLKEEPEEDLTVVLIPTYGCNLRCEYCYEGNLTNTFDYSRLDTQKVKELIVQIKEKFKYKSISFILLGGEPILRKNLIWFKKFFSDFADTNIPYEVRGISNGVEVVNEINTLKEIGVTSVQITLDGMEEQQNIRRPAKNSTINVFKSIVDGIDVLLDNNIGVNVRINVDEKNIPDLPIMHDFFQKKGWWDNDKFFSYIYPISFNGNDAEKKYMKESEVFELVTKELLTIPNCLYDLDFHGISFVNDMLNQEIFYPNLTFCEATTNQLVFDDTGKIYTCWWGTAIEDFTLGNIEEGVSEEFLKKLQRWRDRDVLKIEECIDCKYKFVCGGGCSYKAYLQHGSFKRGKCSSFSENIKVYLEYLIDAGKL